MKISAGDALAKWHTVVRLPSGLARGRRTRRSRVRGRGSRPVLAQNQGVRVAIPAGVFYAPKNTPQGFYIANHSVFGALGVRAKNCVFEA